MRSRDCIQVDIAENTGEPEKVLILAPTARCPFPHTHSQLVLALLQIRRKLELGCIKGILAVSDEAAV